MTVVLFEYETEVALAIALSTAASACDGDMLESGEPEVGVPPPVVPPEAPVPALGWVPEVPEPPDVAVRGGAVVVGLVAPRADGAAGVVVDGVTIESPGLLGDVTLVDAVVEDELPTAIHAPPPMSRTSTAAIAASAGGLGRRLHHAVATEPAGAGGLPNGWPG